MPKKSEEIQSRNRLTLDLTDEDLRILDNLANSRKTTRNAIVRKAIRTLNNLEKETVHLTTKDGSIIPLEVIYS
jgi:predicted transcriptional regulator